MNFDIAETAPFANVARDHVATNSKETPPLPSHPALQYKDKSNVLHFSRHVSEQPPPHVAGADLVGSRVKSDTEIKAVSSESSFQYYSGQTTQKDLYSCPPTSFSPALPSLPPVSGYSRRPPKENVRKRNLNFKGRLI